MIRIHHDFPAVAEGLCYGDLSDAFDSTDFMEYKMCYDFPLKDVLPNFKNFPPNFGPV